MHSRHNYFSREGICAHLINSRAKFKMFDCDFGHGEPIALQPATPPISGFSRVYPRRDNDGVDWLTCLAHDEYGLLMKCANDLNVPSIVSLALTDRILEYPSGKI